MVVWYANAGRRWRWRKVRLAHRWHCVIGLRVGYPHRGGQIQPSPERLAATAGGGSGTAHAPERPEPDGRVPGLFSGIASPSSHCPGSGRGRGL
ncbi:Os04g0267132 [Oryza sativa Japonica Group]|uniref:Os04g0267132 protein n=1 Tax=Oryza sativa subsp. japonica TaxID=39947 RepID=A0A0P0W7Q1_ORYSJ|nr:Os04g0267132 [Oryza sativa Japonica Group]